MNEFRSHIPNFVDTSEQLPLQEFETLAELRGCAWVRSWAELPHFRQFSQSRHHGSEHLLLAEFGPPAPPHWVVGYLKEPVAGLPEWHAPTALDTG